MRRASRGLRGVTQVGIKLHGGGKGGKADSPPASLPITTTHPFASPLSSARKNAFLCSRKNRTSDPSGDMVNGDGHGLCAVQAGRNLSNLSGAHRRMDTRSRGKSAGGARRAHVMLSLIHI